MAWAGGERGESGGDPNALVANLRQQGLCAAALLQQPFDGRHQKATRPSPRGPELQTAAIERIKNITA